MPGSKYDRELRFISDETKRLGRKLQDLREIMPVDPVEAAQKANEVLGIEEKIGELLRRKREIEDSFIAAGMEIPDIGQDLNENIQNARPFRDDAGSMPVRPSASLDELSSEIESVTKELMDIEVRMLRADMNDEEDEKQKLSMMASSLRARRDTLVGEVKALKAEAQRKAEEAPEEPEESELSGRIETLEADNRALRSQISDLRNDVSEMKDLLRQIVSELKLDD